MIALRAGTVQTARSGAERCREPGARTHARMDERASWCGNVRVARVQGMPGHASQRGFTLIEAIAAFVLLALFIGVLMSALSTSMRQTVRAEQESLAAQWAQSKLDLVGIGEKLETGTTRDSFDDTYRWEMTVEEYEPVRDEPLEIPYDPETLGMYLYRVDLDVIWGPRGRERSARFTTLRAYSPDQAVLFNDPAAGDPNAAAMGNQAGQPGRMAPGGRRPGQVQPQQNRNTGSRR
jgi:general secretion pathway protein I